MPPSRQKRENFSKLLAWGSGEAIASGCRPATGARKEDFREGAYPYLIENMYLIFRGESL